MAWAGLQSHCRANANRQRNFQRDHCADTDHGQPAADQQAGTALRLTLLEFGGLRPFYEDRRGIGVVVRQGAVGEEVVCAELAARRSGGTAQNIEVVRKTAYGSTTPVPLSCA